MDYIHIGGKERPFKFGMGALMLFSEERKKTIAEIQSMFSGNQDDEEGESILENFLFGDLIAIVWSGLKAGARAEKQAFDYSLLDVAEWYGDLSNDDREKVFGNVSESMGEERSATKKKKSEEVRKKLQP